MTANGGQNGGQNRERPWSEAAPPTRAGSPQPRGDKGSDLAPSCPTKGAKVWTWQRNRPTSLFWRRAGVASRKAAPAGVQSSDRDLDRSTSMKGETIMSTIMHDATMSHDEFNQIGRASCRE